MDFCTGLSYSLCLDGSRELSTFVGEYSCVNGVYVLNTCLFIESLLVKRFKKIGLVNYPL